MLDLFFPRRIFWPLQMWATSFFSTPTFSTHAVWCCIFYSYVFSRPFLGADHLNPTRRSGGVLKASQQIWAEPGCQTIKELKEHFWW